MRLCGEGTRTGRPVRWRGAFVVVCAVLSATLVAACSRSGLRDPRGDFFGSSGGPFAGGGAESRGALDPRLAVSASERVLPPGAQVPKGGGAYKIGKPYRVAGRWYVPREEPGYDKSGIASWYGTDFHGRRTANGEIYDMNALTAAHPTLPLPSYVTVTNLANGRTLLVRVNDRGPYARGRIIDLSRQTARLLGLERAGVGRVRVRYAGRAPLSGDNRREQSYLMAQDWYRGKAMAASGWPRPAGLGAPARQPTLPDAWPDSR